MILNCNSKFKYLTILKENDLYVINNLYQVIILFLKLKKIIYKVYYKLNSDLININLSFDKARFISNNLSPIHIKKIIQFIIKLILNIVK